MKETRNSIRDVWGERQSFVGKWPSRLDERTLDEPDQWVQSTCMLCSNGCGMDIGVRDGRIVGVRGREKDRVNHGRLGPKGLHAWESTNSPDRLTQPLIKRDGAFHSVSWDEAMEMIVRRSREVIKKHTALGMGFYTTGQLLLEEYYTLAVITRGGLGTPHVDGNTRLCTATAAMALIETFGTDGQPGSYTDLDHTEAILHAGHNIASQQTVLWMRILDRRRGANPPALLVIDPRDTETAKEADVHLKPRLGTNVPLMNGLLALMVNAGHLDHHYIEHHTSGFDKLEEAVRPWTPMRVEEVTGVPVRTLERAADILGTTPSLVSTVLQGFYQSHQATAASIQINNIHLIRGLIGKPGCGILQMNGQPTAQNTRETGCDGALPGFRNWENPEHIEELARIWNVDPDRIPHWSVPTHAMQILRYAEQGSIKFLWISATNPAVSLPELPRIRNILKNDNLFVVVQDAFMTETAQFADVILPAAIWGEKTGTFTNVDRTVHLTRKAVEPPGHARPDLDIFLDYARRMDIRDKSGNPLITWRNPEEAFEAWKICSRGRPCDYSGLSYTKLSGHSGIQWPCNDQYPDGKERLYEDGVFGTGSGDCESYGHDLLTGATYTPEEYHSRDPQGRAMLKAAEYLPAHEQPDAQFPFWLTTGRVVYHFHTRTKTGRAQALQEASPNPFVQISQQDAEALGIKDGDWVRIESRRGHLQASVAIGDILSGHLFIPFHFGYWDDATHFRAANELTQTEWDPVSKQPYFKYAAVRLALTPRSEGAHQPVQEFHPVDP